MANGGDGPSLELEHAIGYSSFNCPAMCWHPNGKSVVYAAGSAVVVGDLTDPHNQVFLRGHDEPVTCLALSPNGDLAASGQGGNNSDVCVWDLARQTLLFRCCEHDHGVSCVSFSHDSKLLATCGHEKDNKLLIWDMSSGAIVAISNQNPGASTCVAWGGMVRDVKRRDTNHYLFACAGSRQLSLWQLDPYAGEMAATRLQAEGRGATVRDYTCLAFSDDRESLYCGTTSGDFVLVRVKSQSIVHTIPACRQGVYSIATWRAGVIVGGGDGSVTCLDANTMLDTAQVMVEGPVVALSFAPDQVEILCGTRSGNTYRLRSGTLQSLLVSEAHSAPLVAVSFAPDASDKFATASLDCTLRVWDAADYGALCLVQVRDAGTPTCLEYTLDFLLSGWTDGKVRAHDCEKGHALWQIDNAHRGGVTALKLSHNERYIITGGADGEVRVWELRTRDLVSHLKEHVGPVEDLRVFQDDVHALSVGRDRNLLCWDLRSEKRITSQVQRMGGHHALALTQDETLVATVGQEKRLTLWDLRDPLPIATTDLSSNPSSPDEALTVAISSDGRWVATGGTGQRLKLWALRKGGQGPLPLVADCEGHSGTIVSLRFSPDDRQLVSAGADGIVLVWNLYV